MTQAREDAAAPGPAAPRRALVAWCLYDWANSAFSAVIVTFVFATYFAEKVAPTPEIGAAWWGYTLGGAGLVIALLSPVLGAVADQGGRRKPWLFAFTVLCIGSTALLWGVLPSTAHVALAIVAVALAHLGFEFATVFYNAMLPDLAGRRWIGRISGWGWGLGYAGGVACLGLALGIFYFPDILGLDQEAAENLRVSGPLVALWMAVFAIPLFLWTPDQPSRGLPFREALRAGLAQLKRTLSQVRRYRMIVRFLIARMIYTDGLNTLFVFGGIYAKKIFGMGFGEVMVFGIALNVTAGLGAAAFAVVDDKIGAKPTIVISLIALIALTVAILLVESKTAFWVLGLCLGVFVGPAQAASRSMMARLAPPEMTTEMFGLFALSGKITAFIGPPLAGWVTQAFVSHRAGMATILVFFLVGLVLLLRVKEPRS